MATLPAEPLQPAARRGSGHLSWLQHAAALAAVMLVSFLWGQLPVVLSPRPWSFGADGDSALHFAIQMKLANPRLLPADPELELYMAARPPMEFMIHRTVAWVGDVIFRGNLYAANIAGFWVLHLIFAAGNLRLGYLVLRSLAGATVFSAASAGASRSLLAWWGMPFSAVIPHSTVAMAMVPWLTWAYLRFGNTARGRLGVFVALGLATNLYPLYPTYLALLIFAVELARGRRRDHLWLPLAFGLAALPSVATAAMRSFGSYQGLSADERAAVEALFQQFYGYLGGLDQPGMLNTLARSPVWWFLAGAVAARTLKRREGLTDADQKLSAIAVATLALALCGLHLAAVHRAFALFLFHRSSALLYIPAYLGCAWLVVEGARRARWATAVPAAVLAALMVANAGRHTALGLALRGEHPPQLSATFYEVCDWARLNIARDRGILIPFSGRETYYGLRAHAARAVFLHSMIGEIVLTNPRAGLRYRDMAAEVAPLYAGATGAEIARVARKYGATHMLVEAGDGHVPDLPVAFRNASYVVLAVPHDQP